MKQLHYKDLKRLAEYMQEQSEVVNLEKYCKSSGLSEFDADIFLVDLGYERISTHKDYKKRISN